ncbi:MAG TPA: anaerobic sulfatase maturase [Prolixibacteraceae bacterium]|nr:anaerobic sulfatase maturase [Prolixibacteraceae bacterium]
MKASDDFQVFVKPVGAHCNMACKYCYYLEKGPQNPETHHYRMDLNLLEKYIVQHIKASPGPDVFFSWHGGEPTLAGINYFKHIVSLQRKYRPSNMRILNGIQTNGTLLNDEWCHFFADENFMVGISIDGPEDLHSVNRQSSKGASCFDKVMRGYQLLKWYGIPFEVLCVVNAHNVDQPERVYRFFKDLGARFITFLPFVEKQLSNKDLVSELSVPSKAFGEFLIAVFEEWKASDIGRVKIQIVEETLRTAFDQEHTLCIFKKTCGRVPVVEHNGDFYSCDHYVNPSHLVGNIGKVPLVELLESRQQKYFGQSKLVNLPNQCLQCEVLDMCNGACPKDRFLKSSEGQPGLNYLCEGYKLFFKHCKPFAETVAEVWKSNNVSSV